MTKRERKRGKLIRERERNKLIKAQVTLTHAILHLCDQYGEVANSDKAEMWDPYMDAIDPSVDILKAHLDAVAAEYRSL